MRVVHRPSTHEGARHGHSLPVANRLMSELGTAVLLIGRDNGIVKYVNDRVCNDLGKRYAELLGHHYKDFFWPEFLPFYERLAISCVDDENEYSDVYYWAERTEWEQVSARIFHLEGSLNILLSITFITDAVLSQYVTNNAVYFDNLLNLPNGAKLEEDLNELAGIETLALLYLRVSGLREINHLYGWHNGDNLLMQIRDWLLSSETRRAQVYRLEDGFAVLGRGVTIEDAKDRAESIEHRFRQPWPISVSGRNISLFCSIKLGIVYGKYIKNEMRSLLLRTAEAAQDGKGYVVYDDETDRKAKWRLKIRDSLINCVHDDMKGFELHYQPIVEAQTGRWIAVEALCRWTASDGENVPADIFIPLAEQLGFIGELDAWVRKRAMQECVALGLHEKDFSLDVNFSPTQKIDHLFVRDLNETLSQTGFPASKLNIEIIESVKMPFDDENLCGLMLIRQQGIRLSLDDFGTGYSTLENLIKISACILKTDKQFLDGIEQDCGKQYLFQTLVNLSRHWNMQVVAEGVETEEQLRLLKRYGVELIQGYLFSRPLTYAQLEQKVSLFTTSERCV